MKKFIFILLFLLVPLFLNACDREGSIDETGERDIHEIVINSVPYVMLGDEMLDFVWYQETDAYGRELFLYQTEPYMTTKDLDIWVICQKTAEDKTYYYQDDCYYVVCEGEVISDSELALLKERNDWGKPLNEDKMTSVYCGKSNADNRNYEFYLQFEKGDKIKEDIAHSFHTPENSYIYLDGLGYDSEGNAVLFVLIHSQDGGAVWERYLVRYDNSLTPQMIDFVAVPDRLNLQEDIHRFRNNT